MSGLEKINYGPYRARLNNNERMPMGRMDSIGILHKKNCLVMEMKHCFRKFQCLAKKIVRPYQQSAKVLSRDESVV